MILLWFNRDMYLCLLTMGLQKSTFRQLCKDQVNSAVWVFKGRFIIDEQIPVKPR